MTDFCNAFCVSVFLYPMQASHHVQCTSDVGFGGDAPDVSIPDGDQNFFRDLEEAVDKGMKQLLCHGAIFFAHCLSLYRLADASTILTPACSFYPFCLSISLAPHDLIIAPSVIFIEIQFFTTMLHW